MSSLRSASDRPFFERRSLNNSLFRGTGDEEVDCWFDDVDRMFILVEVVSPLLGRLL